MMAEIRPLTPGGVPAVAALVRAHMEGWDLDERSLAGLMLDHPWADEELPSLVAEEGGEIVGFVGVQARRIRMDGRSIRGVCSTHGIVAPDRRGGAVGALLLSRVLKGPQDVTSATARPTRSRVSTGSRRGHRSRALVRLDARAAAGALGARDHRRQHPA